MVPPGCWFLRRIEAGPAWAPSFAVTLSASSTGKTRSPTSRFASMSAAADRLSRGGGQVSTIAPSPSGGQSGYPLPVMCHIYLSPDRFSREVLGVELDPSVIASLRYENSFRDPLLAEIAYALLSELQAQPPAGRLLAETLSPSLAVRLLQHHGSPPAEVRA